MPYAVQLHYIRLEKYIVDTRVHFSYRARSLCEQRHYIRRPLQNSCSITVQATDHAAGTRTQRPPPPEAVPLAGCAAAIAVAVMAASC